MPDEKAQPWEQKAQWMTKVEKLIDELLEWDEQTKRPNLTQLEDKVLELRKRMRAAMAKTALEGQARSEPVFGPKYPNVGKR